MEGGKGAFTWRSHARKCLVGRPQGKGPRSGFPPSEIKPKNLSDSSGQFNMLRIFIREGPAKRFPAARNQTKESFRFIRAIQHASHHIDPRRHKMHTESHLKPSVSNQILSYFCLLIQILILLITKKNHNWHSWTLHAQFI
jgi:hypothetical protein